MKIRGWITFLSLAVFVFAITACGGGGDAKVGGGKYSDIKPIMKKFNENTEKWIESMEKADTAKKVAAALSDYVNTMKELQVKMTEMEAKYPELTNMSDPPEELKEEAAKMEEVMTKMMPTMIKAQQFSNDPDVQKALEAFQEVMK
ncbi:hypothetical protein ACFLQZ_04665 [Acidobacteriota bacterium]